jgi:RND family efflux transporter MFP subunit
MNEQARTPPDSLGRDSEQVTSVDPQCEQRRRRTARLLGTGTTTLIAVLVAAGVIDHASQRADAVDTLQAMRAAVPVVRVEAVKPVVTPRQIDLPGTMQPFDSAMLFARATGYITRRNVDIGSHVRQGDVLAVISAPDLDAQLVQARGQLAQMRAAFVRAQANRDLAHATNNRTAQLVHQGWDSMQQGDTDRLNLASQVAAVAVARANVQAQQAQVDRLERLAGFECVIAPFNGVITARQVDVGSLVTANAASGTPLFSIARTDVLRVQVYVPQDAYFGLKDGEKATVTVPELPGDIFHGTVARNASVLHQQTRTLLTEVDVDNTSGTLTGGLYGTVHLNVPRSEPVFIVPSQAVIFNQQGLNVAVYRDGTLQLHHLNLASDDGAQLEVRGGLEPGDQIILDPPVSAINGMRVAVAPTPANVTAANRATSG